jgi:hypothetical protein
VLETYLGLVGGGGCVELLFEPLYECHRSSRHVEIKSRRENGRETERATRDGLDLAHSPRLTASTLVQDGRAGRGYETRLQEGQTLKPGSLPRRKQLLSRRLAALPAHRSSALQARIKKLIQADEDVGKVAQATPVVVCRSFQLTSPGARRELTVWPACSPLAPAVLQPRPSSSFSRPS